MAVCGGKVRRRRLSFRVTRKTTATITVQGDYTSREAHPPCTGATSSNPCQTVKRKRVDMIELPIYEIVCKLIGNINPVGETQIDEIRFANLKLVTELVEKLLIEIDRVAYYNKDSNQFSCKRSGEFAIKFLDRMGIKD